MLRVAAETAAAAAAAAAIAEAAAAAAAATTAAAAAAITSLSVATYEFPDHDQPHQQPTAVQKKKKKIKAKQNHVVPVHGANINTRVFFARGPNSPPGRPSPDHRRYIVIAMHHYGGT